MSVFTVNRRDPRTGKRRDFEILERSEAERRGISFRDWREVTEVGEIGLTDDGYTTELLGIWSGTSKRGHRSVQKTFSLGRLWQNHNNRKQKFLFSERKKAFASWSTHPDSWIAKEKRTTRAKNAVAAYVQYMMQGKAPDWDMIGRIYRPDQAQPAWTAKRLFRQEVIKNMVNAELTRILTSRGATPDYVIQKIMHVINSAESAEDLTNMRLQLRDLAEMLEMFPKTGKVDPFGALPDAGVIDTLSEADIEKERLLYEQKVRELTTHSGNGEATPEPDGV